jgi:hypothetical protein
MMKRRAATLGRPPFFRLVAVPSVKLAFAVLLLARAADSLPL